MFAGYNKSENQRTLTGNWVEEEALRKSTGFSRYKEWTDNHGKTIPSSERKLDGSFQRVIQHNEAEEPKNYKPTSKLDRPDLSNQQRIGTGPRARARQSELLTRAKVLETRLPDTNINNDRFKTSSSMAFTPIDPTYLVQQPRVLPRGRNGRKSSDISDTTMTFRDREEQDEALLQTYHPDLAISHYSDAIQHGQGLNFAITPSTTSDRNPFAKSTAFTNDIRDPSKRHGEASEPGQSQAVRTGFSPYQRSVLNRMNSSLTRQGIQPHEVQKHLNAVSTNNSGTISRNDFEHEISRLNMNVTRADIQQIFMYFQTNDKTIRVDEFIEALNLV